MSLSNAIPLLAERGTAWRHRVSNAAGLPSETEPIENLTGAIVKQLSGEERPRLRIGFIGAAGIAKKTWQAVHDAGHSVTFVGCRDVERGSEFVRECQSITPFPAVPRVGSYDDVIRSSDVDAVYIAIPVTMRLVWVQAAAAAKKHVVCEKPCAPTLTELAEMLKACRENGVVFIDGTMLSHGTRVGAVAATIDECAGVVRRMHASMHFVGDAAFDSTDIRMKPGLEPHGCLGDLGWYCIRYALHLNGLAEPYLVDGTIDEASPNGAIASFSGRLVFRSGVIFTFDCSFRSSAEMVFTVRCTDALVQVPDFVLPRVSNSHVEFTVTRSQVTNPGLEVRYESREERVRLPESSTFQETQLWRQLGVAAGANGASLREHWQNLTLLTQGTMERLLDSARAKRP
jgi:predicted dehydrogenase